MNAFNLRIVLKRFIGVFWTCVGIMLLVTNSSTLLAHANRPASNFTIQLGPIEVVRGPDTVADTPFNTLFGATALLGYTGNASTWGYIGGSLETLRPLSATVIQGGTTFDSCGAWLNSVRQDGAVIRGWYHAETACPYPQTHKSVAYAESYDGGRTFVKPNYPNNQVLTAPAVYTDPDTDDVGDHRVIQIGDYFYMYFLANQPSWQIYLARAPVSTHGLPGTWQKYYNGAFTQPGLGGEASPIAPWNALATSWVSYHPTRQIYLGFSGVWDNTITRQVGFGLATATDGMSDWAAPINPATNQPYRLLSYEGSWDRVADNKDLVAYPSFVSVYGDSDQLEDVFWLYYMYLNPGADFDQRFLVRRKVWLSPAASNVPSDLAPRIALAKYQNLDDTWFTTTNTDQNYQSNGIIGYLFTEQIPNSVPVYDCYISFWHDHMLVPNDTTCGGGNVQYLRRAGWISTVPFNNSIQVYRCWDEAVTNHFISTDPACEGKTVEWSMGYLATLPTFPSNRFVALSDYYRAEWVDNWVTTAAPPITYTFQSRLGYLFTQSEPDSVPVYDCYIDFWNDHMLVPNDSSCDGAQNLGMIGWIATKPLPTTIPIYRCFDEQATNHFVWLDDSCNGKRFEWRMGYIATYPSLIWKTYLPAMLR